MARGVNKVILIGNLGADPEVKYMPSGDPVTNISIATSEQWKDKNNGETVTKTEWHRVVFFNRLAEIAGEYLKKGSKVFVEGKLTTNKWTDNNGVDRYSTQVVARELQMLDTLQNKDNQPRQSKQSGEKQGNNANNNSDFSDPFNEFDDDIPF